LQVDIERRQVNAAQLQKSAAGGRQLSDVARNDKQSVVGHLREF
jgi:hypothetical protein